MNERDKRLDEIIRVKREPNNFVTMNKTFLEDDRLSYKAKGILAYLLSKPNDWKVIVGNLVGNSSDGKSSVYSGLKELKDYGYYKKIPIRNEQGTRIVRWESTICEVPDSLLTDFPKVENKGIENQFLENRERNNNYNTNNYNTNIYNQSVSQKNDRCGSSVGQPDEVDLKTILELIYENIGYGDLKIVHQQDIELIDEFINIILDAVLSQSKTVRINGEDKPRELVRSNMLKLRYADIEYVLDQFKNYEGKIKKKHQYILSMLYSSSMERNLHFENAVHSDFGY